MIPYNEREVLKLLQEESTQRKGFEMIVAQYSEQLYWQIRRMVLSHEDANDLLQNTFIKAWMNIDYFRAEAKLSTWLYRIAYNVFYDHLRSQHEVNRLETAQVDALYHTEQQDLEEHNDLYLALSTLKEIERTCITLFYMDDLSIEKIAGITGCPTGTVKSHLKRGKEKLSTYLRNNGYER